MLLTINYYPFILKKHSKKTSARRGNLNYSGCKAANHAVFYCPSKIKMGLIRFKNVMTGCFRQLSSWPFPEFGISTLLQSVTHSVERVSDSLQSNSGVSIMLKSHKIKPSNNTLTNTASKKPQSRFNVLTHSGRSIARKIPFNEAIRLKSGRPDLTIKFSGMESLS